MQRHDYRVDKLHLHYSITCGLAVQPNHRVWCCCYSKDWATAASFTQLWAHARYGQEQSKWRIVL